MNTRLFVFEMTTSRGWTDASAQPAYIADIKGTAWDRVGDMALDSQGNTILVGNFGGTCDFDPGPGTENRTATGPYDGFVAKYDPNGALLQSASLAGGKPASSPVHPDTSPLTGSVGP
jgi:hypothetical protein